MMRLKLMILILIPACGTAMATLSWRPLWDGKTLNGWHNRGKDAWTVEKETPSSAPALLGKHSSASDDYSMLYTDKLYDFFTIHVSYRMLAGNSGVYRLTVRDLAGKTLAVRLGTGPQSFGLPEIRMPGAYLVSLESRPGTVVRWREVLAP
jgi:hypothetical protein